MAKLVATLQDVKAGLATNPNKRKCERLSSTIKEAYQLLEALENELNETEPDALVLDKEDTFDSLAEGEISLRRLVSSYKSKLEDREDALAEESSEKELRDKVTELVNSIGANSRKYKKALANTEQYVKEPPEKGLVNIFRTATFGTVNPIFEDLSGQLTSLLRYSDAAIQAAVPGKTRESFLLAMEEAEGSMAETALKWGRSVSYTHLTLPTICRCRSRWSPYH